MSTTEEAQMGEKLVDVPTVWPGVNVKPRDPEALRHERTANFLKTVSAGMQRRLVELTIPLAKKGADRAEHHGSGVLLRVADHSFLITAAHVLNQQGDPVYIPESGENFVPLTGKVVAAEDRERVDVAVVELSEKYVKDLLALGQKFLRLDEIEAIKPEALPHAGYAVFGYPDAATIEHPDVNEPTPLYYGCTRFDGSTAHLGSFDPSINFALKLAKEARHTFKGKVEAVPDFAGMSGCSIWRTYEKQAIVQGWAPKDAPMIGVQSGVFPKTGVVMGVSWPVVEQLIRFGWKDLAPAMDLIHGSNPLVSVVNAVNFALK